MMRIGFLFVVVFVCARGFLRAGGLPVPAPAAQQKIKVLIVDGFSNHDWQQTTRLLRGILEPTGLFAVAVSTTPPTANADGWDVWRPAFADYDVVIQTCNDIGQHVEWPRQVQLAFEDYVRGGGGVYIFHSAQNAFPKWPVYNDIIGLGWRPKTYGTAITVNADETLTRIPPGEGKGTGHGARSEVLVHLLGDHPIHAGMPRAWRTPDLEVYRFARGPAENVEVLAWGRDPGEGMNWPLEWTVRYGQGRAYLATFGHVWKGDVEPEGLRCVGVQTSIVRALQWLAGRPVTFPVPADFPTAEAISVRPIKDQAAHSDVAPSAGR